MSSAYVLICAVVIYGCCKIPSCIYIACYVFARVVIQLRFSLPLSFAMNSAQWYDVSAPFQLFSKECRIIQFLQYLENGELHPSPQFTIGGMYGHYNVLIPTKGGPWICIFGSYVSRDVILDLLSWSGSDHECESDEGWLKGEADNRNCHATKNQSCEHCLHVIVVSDCLFVSTKHVCTCL